MQAEYSDMISVRLALCAPSSCRAPVLEAALNGLLGGLNKLVNGTGFRLQAELPEEYTYLSRGWRQPAPRDWAVV